MIEEWLMNHAQKIFPTEPTNIIIDDPYIMGDSNFFIWASTMFMFYKYKIKNEEDRG